MLRQLSIIQIDETSEYETLNLKKRQKESAGGVSACVLLGGDAVL